MTVVDDDVNETRKKYAGVPIANYNTLIPPVSLTEHNVLATVTEHLLLLGAGS